VPQNWEKIWRDPCCGIPHRPDLYRARNVVIIMSLMLASFGCKPGGQEVCPQYYVCDAEFLTTDLHRDRIPQTTL